MPLPRLATHAPVPSRPSFSIAVCVNYTVTPFDYAATTTPYLYLPASQVSPGIPIIVAISTGNSIRQASFFVAATTTNYTAELVAGTAMTGQVGSGAVGACAHGCVGAWVRVRMGAWVRGCVGAWVRGCVIDSTSGVSPFSLPRRRPSSSIGAVLYRFLVCASHR
jgi:hypothetical protein